MVLGDDAKGLPISGLAGVEDRQVQEVPRVRARNIEAYDRGNRVCRLNWQVSQEHSNEAAAALHFVGHPDQVPVAGTLTLTQQGPTGAATRVFAGCIKSVERVALIGVTTVFGYQFVGGAPAANKTLIL